MIGEEVQLSVVTLRVTRNKRVISWSMVTINRTSSTAHLSYTKTPIRPTLIMRTIMRILQDSFGGCRQQWWPCFFAKGDESDVELEGS